MIAPRARDIGIPFPGMPGLHNAITDVPGVTVGHTTLIEGDGPLVVGKGPIRTGVTTILPRGKTYDPVFAGTAVLNGNGEMTGTQWIEESGFLDTPIAITNTHSVGVVRDAMLGWMVEHRLYDPPPSGAVWLLPVVAETYDGVLNDINGFHVRPEHVIAALESAASGLVAEGGVGGGTGMTCHGFKGGIGTSSRKVEDGGFTLGVLVQANHGARRDLTLAGVAVGQHITGSEREIHSLMVTEGTGSIIVIIATDAPLLPHQLKRLARRATIGIGRLGAYGANSSGDLFLAFSTANPGAARRSRNVPLEMLPNDQLDPFFRASVEVTEEAIANALIAGRTMTGINGNTVYDLPHDQVREIMGRFGRLDEAEHLYSDQEDS